MAKIAGVKHWLWRAVDRNGMVPDILVRSRRDEAATERLLRGPLKRRRRAPGLMITDEPAGYAAAKRGVVAGGEHRGHKGLNNRAENLHRPTRRRERRMKRFKSPGHARRSLSAYDGINNLFHLRHHRVPARHHRAARTQAFRTWAEVTGVARIA